MAAEVKGPRIWKFEFHNHFGSHDVMVDRITMPKDAKILSVQSQSGWPMVWAIVNPDNPKVERIFWIVPTGTPPFNNTNYPVFDKPYLGTVQLTQGLLIYHIFDGGEILDSKNGEPVALVIDEENEPT